MILCEIDRLNTILKLVNKLYFCLITVYNTTITGTAEHFQIKLRQAFVIGVITYPSQIAIF